MPVIPATLEAETGGLQFDGSSSRDPVSKTKPDVVLHVCNSSYSEGIGRRIVG
jgi:hypothetical protein